MTPPVDRRPTSSIASRSRCPPTAPPGSSRHVGNNFVYDGVGRLTSAWVGSLAYTYAFAPTGGCGSTPSAGKNTNRTVDNGVTKTYCYDAADRLTSSSDAAVGTPTYDAHGNTTSLATPQTMTYDGADRHMSTTTGAATVRYTRVVTDRIVARLVNGSTVARYGFSGDGDPPDFTMDGSSNVVERDVSLLGGVTVTKRSAGDVWSYPNVHGDVVASANSAGAKQGATLFYDPFGTALAGTVDNSTGNYDYGCLGEHQKGLEHEGSLGTIEMGARQYGRASDGSLRSTLEGGSANDYDYVGADPVNGFDLAGTYRNHKGLFGYVRDSACHSANVAEASDEVLREWPSTLAVLPSTSGQASRGASTRE
jgi:hypothetical protein